VQRTITALAAAVTEQKSAIAGLIASVERLATQNDVLLKDNVTLRQAAAATTISLAALTARPTPAPLAPTPVDAMDISGAGPTTTTTTTTATAPTGPRKRSWAQVSGGPASPTQATKTTRVAAPPTQTLMHSRYATGAITEAERQRAKSAQQPKTAPGGRQPLITKWLAPTKTTQIAEWRAFFSPPPPPTAKPRSRGKRTSPRPAKVKATGPKAKKEDGWTTVERKRRGEAPKARVTRAGAQVSDAKGTTTFSRSPDGTYVRSWFPDPRRRDGRDAPRRERR